ncbi:MAG: membrane-bound serine protease (ClpP class) [Janthinobacterium sp.]|jgi:membrane-bound serine protease (ClpP class)
MLRSVPTRFIGLCLVVLGVFAHFVAAQPQLLRPLVYVVPITGVIDLGLVPFVTRGLDEATQAGAAVVIFDIDTFGGRVDAAVQIRDALLSAKVHTVAFVNKRAISAGALIALSAQTLVMSSGGTIGAAAPVQVGMPGAAAVPAQEKTVSYVRKEFRATAEARKRPLLLSEAMVDADVVVPGIIEKGKLLTLTTDEALQYKVADLRADTLDAVLQQLDLAGAQVHSAKPHWAEQLVRFLTHPVMGSLLISMGMLGIMVELRTPGFGIPGAIGVSSLALFFWGHWLVQLAGWEELLLAGIGLLFLAVEILVIPGFGVLGTLGIAALLGALALSMVGAGDTAAVIVGAMWRVVLALLAALLGSLVLLRFLPRLPLARRMILQTDLGSGPTHGSAPEADQQWLGKQGRALSILRPAGIASIEGARVDVVSDGAMIDADAPIEVIRVDGNRIVVRQIVHINLMKE